MTKQNLKTLELVTAIKPSTLFVEIINLWAKKELYPNVKISIKTEPSIIGGAIISFEGKYFDFSVKKALDEYFRR